jgi:N-acyl-D-amino-acid deacylase
LIFLGDRQPELIEGRIRQGITTEIIGNCGISVSPIMDEVKQVMEASVGWMTPEKVPWEWNTMAEYLDLVEKKTPIVNVGSLTGHGAIRAYLKGFDAGVSSPEEISKMQDLLRQTFEQGSFGLSSGLIYAPGMFADTNELMELGKIVAEYSRIYTSHIRGSSETDIDAEQEVITVGEEAGCRVHRSHYEAFGEENWDKIEVTLRMDEEARDRGVDISFDMFPYTAAMTMMVAIYPPWALDGGWPQFVKRVQDPETRKKIEYDIENLINLAQLGQELNKSPFDAITDLLVEEEGAISQLIFGVSGDRDNEEPIKAIVKHPLGGYATDAIDIGRGKPHPAAYGTYPRILGKYVREEKLLTLEDAIRRMTSFPASRLGIRDRGIIAEGYFADLVLFDPDKIIDRATFEDPRQFAEGIECIIINGQPLLEGGKLKDLRPGKVLRK